MTDRHSTITPDTRVPLSVLWTLVTVAIFGTASASTLLYGIYNRLGTIESAVRDSWTTENQKLFIAEMRAGNLNTPLYYPDPDTIKGRK